MAFKPNYRQQRSDRTRAKEQKKQEKLQKREEEAARRKESREDGGEISTDEELPDGTASQTPPESSDGPQENPH